MVWKSGAYSDCGLRKCIFAPNLPKRGMHVLQLVEASKGNSFVPATSSPNCQSVPTQSTKDILYIRLALGTGYLISHAHMSAY